MRVEYMQVVMDNFDERFFIIPFSMHHIFNASKLFSSNYDSSDEEALICMLKYWLMGLILKFKLIKVERKVKLIEFENLTILIMA
jgi:hypothetical protein